MKLLALAALAASLFAADPAPAPPTPAPPVKVHTLTKDQQLELLGVIAESVMLTQKAEASPDVLAAKAALQKQNEVVDKVRVAIDCKACGFNVQNGKITVLEPPPPPPLPAATTAPAPAQP